jgi:signal peptidase I
MKKTASPQKLPKKKNSLISKILSWLLGLFVFALLGMEVVGFISAKSNYGVNSYFGYQTMIVLTDSMEPSLPVGDGIVVKAVPPESLVASTTVENHDGDIITFYRSSDQIIVTHRIIEVIDDGDGTLTFRCLGDNLQAQTCPAGGCTIANSDYVGEEYVLGKVIEVSSTIGFFHTFFTSPWITLILVLIPLGLIFASSVKDFIKAAKMKEESPQSENNVNNSAEFVKMKEQEKLLLLKEIEKEKLRQEMGLSKKEKTDNNEKEGK